MNHWKSGGGEQSEASTSCPKESGHALRSEKVLLENMYGLSGFEQLCDRTAEALLPCSGRNVSVLMIDAKQKKARVGVLPSVQ